MARLYILQHVSSKQAGVRSLVFSFAVLLTVSLAMVNAESIYRSSQEDLCVPCDINQLPADVLNVRLLNGCTACGYMFSSAHEHCCVCHDAFFRKCQMALRK